MAAIFPELGCGFLCRDEKLVFLGEREAWERQNMRLERLDTAKKYQW